MTTRQEAATTVIRARVQLGDAVMPYSADLVLAAADREDREAGIYRIKLDDELRDAIHRAIQSWAVDGRANASAAAELAWCVLRERAET